MEEGAPPEASDAPDATDVPDATEGGEPEGGPPPEAPEAPEPVDWEGKVNNWGGESTVDEAMAIYGSLSTKEGVETLAKATLNALGISDDKIEALFAAAPPVDDPNAPETIESLLSDPDRTLTAAEVRRLIEHNNQEQMAAAAHANQVETVRNAISSTFEALGVTDEGDQSMLLSIADRLLNTKGELPSPDEVTTAIKAAHEQFTGKVKQMADQLLKDKKKQNEGLPSGLPNSGGAGGGNTGEPPSSVREVFRRIREGAA